MSAESEAPQNNNTWETPHSKAARGKLSGHWSTPRLVLDEVRDLMRERGLAAPFAVDVAADPGSTVAPDWFGPSHMDPARRDALQGPIEHWSSPRGLSWLNPPYADVAAFADRCVEYAVAARGGKIKYPLLFLTFARIDTAWFHRCWPHVSGLWARRGRISFVDPTTGSAKSGAVAPAPSILIAFGPMPPPPAGGGSPTSRWQFLGSGAV